MRDKIKDKKYFDEFIDKLKTSQERRFDKLKSNKIKNDRISSVKRDMSKNYLKIIFAKYSREDDTNELKSDLQNAIVLFSESWHKNHISIIQSQKNNEDFLNQYSQSAFMHLLDLLSLSILLNISTKDFNLIINFIDKDKVSDFLFEFLISKKIEDREKIKEESYKEFFGINQKFGTLKEIIQIENKKEAENKIKFFLENEWLKSFKDDFIYGDPKSKHNTYSGYWCFIAPTIVKIKDLDDSSFRDNKYYPSDLIKH